MELEQLPIVGIQLSRHVMMSIVRRYGGKQRRLSFNDFVVITCRISAMYRKSNWPCFIAQLIQVVVVVVAVVVIVVLIIVVVVVMATFTNDSLQNKQTWL